MLRRLLSRSETLNTSNFAYSALEKTEDIRGQTTCQVFPCCLLHSRSPHRTTPTTDDYWRVQWYYHGRCVATECGQRNMERGTLLYMYAWSKVHCYMCMLHHMQSQQLTISAYSCGKAVCSMDSGIQKTLQLMYYSGKTLSLLFYSFSSFLHSHHLQW